MQLVGLFALGILVAVLCFVEAQIEKQREDEVPIPTPTPAPTAPELWSDWLWVDSPNDERNAWTGTQSGAHRI